MLDVVTFSGFLIASSVVGANRSMGGGGEDDGVDDVIAPFGIDEPYDVVADSS